MFQRASMKLGLEQAVMSNGKKNISADVVETLLKEGAYSALLEDKEGDERSRTFCESDINELLEKQSRVIKYDKATTNLFSKTSFVSNQADAKLDVNDPLFWKKIFGQDTRETVLERLEDGRATESSETKANFVKELTDMGEEVIQQKLSGAERPRMVHRSPHRPAPSFHHGPGVYGGAAEAGGPHALGDRATESEAQAGDGPRGTGGSSQRGRPRL